MMELLIGFFISLLISGLIIFLATKLMGEQEGFGTAIMVAFAGTIIFTLASFFLGTGWIAGLIGLIAWLIALGSFYNISWIKSLIISIVIWIFTVILSLILTNA